MQKVRERVLESGSLQGKEIEGWDIVGDNYDCPGLDRLPSKEAYDLAHVAFVDGTSTCVVLIRNG